MQKQVRKRDKIIDGSIKVLKIIGRNGLFFGLFLVLEGLSLIFKREWFPFFIAVSILIAYAFAIEWFFDVLRAERSFWITVQRILIVVLIIALLIYCGFMIFNADFRITVDRVIVCATTTLDGMKNLVRVMKSEYNPTLRKIFIAFSLVCVVYGIIYGILGGAEANLFTTTLHGIVFIFCGLTDIWLFVREKQQEKLG